MKKLTLNQWAKVYLGYWNIIIIPTILFSTSTQIQILLPAFVEVWILTAFTHYYWD